MKFIYTIILFSTFFASLHTNQISAQTIKQIKLKSGNINTVNNFNSKIPFSDNQIFNSFRYKVIQFENIPSVSIQNFLASKKIVLLDYIPDNAYWVAIPTTITMQELADIGIRTIIDIPLKAKFSDDIRNNQIPAYAIDKGGNVQLIISCHANVDLQLAQNQLSRKNSVVLKIINESKTIFLSTSINNISSIANLPFVHYVECIAPLPTPDDTKGRSLHRSNAINTQHGAGRKYDGTGVTMGVADDGQVGPHIDFKGRLIQLAIPSTGNHGDMVSGIAVGAGNLNPDISGMATGARLVAFDIDNYPHLLDALTNYNTYDLVITSTSYSQGCNTYTSDTELIDDQLFNNRQLLHNFSGGNNAAADCNYGGVALTGWGNITGGFKLGKNVMAVANIDALGVRDISSSRGPAPDGRIKPDIAANGKGQLSTNDNNTYQTGGGTSAASPGIAGISAQLYQAYRQLNGGANPDGTLIKSILLNTADEIGNDGPDFSFGFGRVNALKAVKVLENRRYFSDTIFQNDTNLAILNVPAKTIKLKVLIHWRDKGGSPSASKSLVSDLDMRLVLPNGSIALPWVLNTTSNATALNLPATKGNDSLNNVEQITIDNPQAGDYLVKIYGTTIPFGSQDYYVTYEYLTEDIVLTYPIGDEGFEPGDQEVIRWDAEGNAGNFTLAYSINNGSTYTNISTTISGSLRQYTWAVPTLALGNNSLFLKISRGLFADSNKTAIGLIEIPEAITFLQACSDSIVIEWENIPGAATYEIRKLGLKYMDSIATSTTNSIKIASLSTDTNWYSVRAIAASGAKGRRAKAVQKLPGTISCTQLIDASLNSILFPKADVYYTCDSISKKFINVAIRNVGINAFSNISISYKIDGLLPINTIYSGVLNSTGTLNYSFPISIGKLDSGEHSLLVFVKIIGDVVSGNDTIYTKFIIGNEKILPFTELFSNNSFITNNWQSILSDVLSPGWIVSNPVIQNDGSFGTAIMFDNYNFDNRTGLLDQLKSPLINLPLGKNKLIFDRAYQIYPGFYDSLMVTLSDDCGKNFEKVLFNKGYNSLASTLDSPQMIFSPASINDWKSDTIDISAYSGKSVVINFVNKCDYGNRLYIDNVKIVNDKILSTQDLFKMTEINVFPNPSSGIFTVKSFENKSFNYIVNDINGKKITAGSFLSNGIIDLTQCSNGIYFIQLISNDGVVHHRIYKN